MPKTKKDIITENEDINRLIKVMRSDPTTSEILDSINLQGAYLSGELSLLGLTEKKKEEYEFEFGRMCSGRSSSEIRELREKLVDDYKKKHQMDNDLKKVYDKFIQEQNLFFEHFKKCYGHKSQNDCVWVFYQFLKDDWKQYIREENWNILIQRIKDDLINYQDNIKKKQQKNPPKKDIVKKKRKQ